MCNTVIHMCTHKKVLLTSVKQSDNNPVCTRSQGDSWALPKSLQRVSQSNSGGYDIYSVEMGELPEIRT